MIVRRYQELVAWQKAMEFAAQVYKVTGQFPKEEIYALTNQVRRAAVSVPSNIAEGQGRGAAAEFSRYLKISQGSLQEVETQLLLAARLGHLSAQELEPLLELSAEVGRVTRALHASICPSSD